MTQARPDMYARKWAGDEPVREVGPVLLEPTPAQLAQGVRILEIEQTSQVTAMRMLRWARENGWGAALTRSRYLAEPKTGGEESRRGRRLEVETVALRLHNETVWAYARWDFDMERGRWGAGDCLTAWIGPAGLVGLRSVNVTGLQVVMGMKSEGG